MSLLSRDVGDGGPGCRHDTQSAPSRLGFRRAWATPPAPACHSMRPSTPHRRTDTSGSAPLKPAGRPTGVSPSCRNGPKLRLTCEMPSQRQSRQANDNRDKPTTIVDRQRGRVRALHELDAAAAREKIEKRAALQKRVELAAWQHRVMVEALHTEKELEARRCKLCDILRAEAWGLGHADWTQRRCGRCWLEAADALARQRHRGPVSRARAARTTSTDGS